MASISLAWNWATMKAQNQLKLTEEIKGFNLIDQSQFLQQEFTRGG
jgi:hypothetical protein